MGNKVFVLLVFVLMCVFSSAQTIDPSIYANDTMNESSKKLIPQKDMEMLAKIINPAELTLQEIRPDNINAKVVGTDVIVSHQTDENEIKRSIAMLKGQIGIDKVIEMLKGMRSGTMASLTFDRHIRVYEINPIYENKKKLLTYRSKEALEFVADRDYDEVRLIHIVPRTVAENISQLYFENKLPLIIEKKPVTLMWTFKNVKEGDVLRKEFFLKTLVVGDEADSVLAVGVADNLAVLGTSDNQVTGLASGVSKIEAELERLGVGFANKLVVFGILAAMLLAFGIVVIEMDDKDRFRKARNFSHEVLAAVKLGSGNKATVDNYINDCLKKGMSLEEIRKSLVDAGWDRKAVRSALYKHI